MNNIGLDSEVKLFNANDDYGLSIAAKIMMKDNFFADKMSRLYTSAYTALIKVDNKVVGMANLVTEKMDYNFLFLDMVIKPNYRGNGYAKQALEKISKFNTKAMIIAETKKDNIRANKAIEEIGILVTEIEDRNIYLVQKGRYVEFLENGYMTLLGKHFEKPSNKKLLLQEY